MWEPPTRFPFRRVARTFLMPSPLERTFETLLKREGGVASELLIEAVGRDDALGVAAVLAVGRSGPLGMKSEVLTRVDTLSAEQRDALRAQSDAFAAATKHMLESREADRRLAAVRWVEAVEDYARFPLLVNRLATTPEEELPELTAAIESMTNRMFDHGDGRKGGRQDDYSLRDADSLRDAMHRSLVDAVAAIETQPCPGPLLEWSLVLADAEGAGIPRLMSKVPSSRRPELLATLRTSVHPGVLRLPLELLKRSTPLDFVNDIWRDRVDEPFVHYVLRTFPDRLTDAQTRHVAAITELPWLADDGSSLDSIPAAYRAGLAKLVTSFGLPEEQKRATLRWLLNNGDAETRAIASNSFSLLGQNERAEILRDGLDHEESNVRVWATRNLRPQEVPGAHALLLARLDSEDAAVREAARAELSDVNLAMAAEMMDRAPERVTPEFGALLLKINPDLTAELRQELANPIRGRRVAAARLTAALGLVADVESAVTALTEDVDMLVRRTAVEALRAVVTRNSVAAVQRCLHDESSRVREAAISVLQEMRVRAAASQETKTEAAK